MVGPAGDTKLSLFGTCVFLSPLTLEIVAPPMSTYILFGFLCPEIIFLNALAILVPFYLL